MKTRSILSVSVIGLALALVLGITFSSSETTHENKIRVAYFPNIGHAIPIVGMEKEFFQANLGSDVTIETRIFDSGPQAIESLFANSVDLAYVGPGPAITGFLNSDNSNIKILAGAASGGASFIVHPNSEINSVSDFVGKKIAAPQIGNTQDVSLRSYLSDNDLKPAEKGGNVIVYNISNPDIYTLFVKGDIDAAWVPEPWATLLENGLGGKRLFYEEDLWPNKEFASVLLIGNVDYIERNPQIVKNFLNAHHKTADWINQNPIETRNVFNDFLKHHLGKSMPDDIVDITLSNIVITTDPLPDSVYLFAEKADDLGYLGRNGYDLSEIFYYDSNSVLEGDT